MLISFCSCGGIRYTGEFQVLNSHITVPRCSEASEQTLQQLMLWQHWKLLHLFECTESQSDFGWNVRLKDNPVSALLSWAGCHLLDQVTQALIQHSLEQFQGWDIPESRILQLQYYCCGIKQFLAQLHPELCVSCPAQHLWVPGHICGVCPLQVALVLRSDTAVSWPPSSIWAY